MQMRGISRRTARRFQWSLVAGLAAAAFATSDANAAGTSARESFTATSRSRSLPPPARLPVAGLMVDAGVPDGANLSLVYRPAAWLRTQVGGGYNLISKGVRGGVSLIPFGQGPSLSVEAGHYFDGDANGMMRKVAGGFSGSPVLERIGYDYANAHLGLELGKRWFTFFIHGGMSYVRAQIHNLDAEIGSQVDKQSDGTSTTVAVKQDPVIRAYTPSVKLGFLFYVW